MSRDIPSAAVLAQKFPDVEESMQKIYLIKDFSKSQIRYKFFSVRGRKQAIVVFLTHGFLLILTPHSLRDKKYADYYTKARVSWPLNPEKSLDSVTTVLSMQADLFHFEDFDTDKEELTMQEFDNELKKLIHFPSRILSGVFAGPHIKILIQQFLKKLEQQEHLSLRPIMRGEEW